MIYDPLTNTPAVSFYGIRDDARWLRELLVDQGADVAAGSELADALNLAESLPELSDPTKAPQDFDPRRLAGPVGLAYLTRALRLASTSKSFPTLHRLLPYLGGSKSTPLEMIDGCRSFDRDMVFELLMAAVVMGLYGNTKSASEPDIEVDDGQSTWDIACKLIYSPNPVTLNDQVEKGISQIRRFKSAYGLVFIGLTNRVDQSLFLPLVSAEENRWGSFSSGDIAYAKLRKLHADNHDAILAQREVRFLSAREDQKFRGVITVLQTMVGIGPVPMIITSVGFIPRRELFDEVLVGAEDAFADKLHERMQNLFAA